MNRIANREAGLAQQADRQPSPLESLPEDWRRPVGFFWSVWKESLKGSLALSSRLMLDIEAGLTLDDAKVIFRKLCSPEKRSEIQFATHLLAELAKEVDAVLSRKKQIQAMLDRRELAQASPTASADVARLREFIGERFGSME